MTASKLTGAQGYWFKRRRYGYGWTPVRWQGWFVVLLILAGLVATSMQLNSPHMSWNSSTAFFTALFVLECILLAAICRLKGPMPHWRWGMRSTDSPDEDY